MALNILHQVVGKTRTGRAIVWAMKIEDIKGIHAHFKSCDFSDDDFFDAFAVFEYLSIRAKRKNDVLLELYEEHAFEMRSMLSLEEYNSHPRRARAVSHVTLSTSEPVLF